MNKTPSIDENSVFPSLTLMNNLPQPLKQPAPREVTPSGIATEVRAEQPLKQEPPMEVREEGSVREVREEHL